ncbi:hypothetical protein GETHLI_30790 [Geothrix limicola]|uniref:Uncharacterized protein n=1 Tax=Geothrix limicola TaxID=2927978 RepID=A0ABQ5QIQ1_9BACT|nr:hypothetical protein [Geothrix limicola]GLH74577.1 hypothetical protein GETHLI_30790 [Geothrix limicola]
MRKCFFALAALFTLGGLGLGAHPSPDLAPAPSYLRRSARSLMTVNASLPPAFERERGVCWDGRIGWKTEERAWGFATALEGSLREITRPGSPYRLTVEVIRVEKQTGTFVVEFTIQDASGEEVEVVQVEGKGPRDRSAEAVDPALAGEMVATFKKSVLK